MSNIKNRTLLLLTNLCRLLLAAVFIVSGFVKAVDPKGLLYKLQEYANVFAVESDFVENLLLPSAIFLSAIEFVLGVMLFMGTSRRFSTVAILIVMLVFTPWTLVLAVWNPVHDCGCFGDAFKISNWNTFFKNIILLFAAAFLWIKRGRIVRFVSTKSSWAVTLFAICYIGCVEYYGLVHLPVMDFRPFAIGADLNEGVNEIPSEYKVLFRYEKNGQVLELEEEGAPDSTWNYLGTRSEMVTEGVPAKINDFLFSGIDDGDDISEELLFDTGYICLLVIERVETADESRADKINDIYDYCVENGIPFYAATSSLEEDIELWRKRTGAEYPFYSADNLLLKTMVRSNPGLLVIKGGKVVDKWSVKDVPELYDVVVGDDDSLADSGNGIPFIRENEKKNAVGKLFHWMFMFFTPLLLIFLCDAVVRFAQREKTDEQMPVKNEGDVV